jgi:hypothetical protein
MLFDDVLKNPLLRKAVEAGEERVGRAVVRSSEPHWIQWRRSSSRAWRTPRSFRRAP